MKKLLLLFTVLLTTLSASAGNTITYTSVYNLVIQPSNPEAFDANIVSNTNENGQGKIVFDKDITVIGDEAFSGAQIYSIEIPNSVTKIGRRAFADCSPLESIVIPNSVTEIGDIAFGFCGNLSKVTFGNSVNKIGIGVFVECQRLERITSLNVTPPDLYIEEYEGDSICVTFDGFDPTNCILKVPAEAEEAYKSAIGWKEFKILVDSNNTIIYINRGNEVITPYNEWAFGANIISNTCEDGIGKIVFDAELTTIGDYAFNGCNFQSIELPNSVTSIGERAFAGCSNMKSINLPNSLTYIGYAAFKESGLEKINIPNSVTTIEAWAFDGCLGLTEIKLPDSLTTISVQLLYNCSSLRTIQIPKTVTEIQDGAFEHCTNLRSIELPKTLTTIESALFKDCYYLTSVNIPSTVTCIESEAFYNCQRLASIDIPNSVEVIWNDAFNGCYSLKTVTIPEALEYVQDRVFNNCTSLEAFYGKFASEDHRLLICDGSLRAVAPAGGLTELKIPVSVTELGEGICAYLSNLTKVVFPSSITFIYPNAFMGCTGLTSLELPNSIKGIGDQAFAYCIGLTELNLPKSVEYIGANAFKDCRNITHINTGNGVKTIDNNAFSGCTNLKTLTLGKSVEYMYGGLGTSPNIEEIISLNPQAPSLGWYNTAGAFHNDVKENCRLKVPAKALDSYRTTAGWMEFKNINESEEIKFAENRLWYIVLPDLNDAVEVTYKERHQSYVTGDIVIPAYVEHEGKTYKVLGIGDEAFYNCYLLKSVKISEGIGYIGRLAFYGCHGLRKTILPPSLADIDPDAFTGCGGQNNPSGGSDGPAFHKIELLAGTEVIQEEQFKSDGGLDEVIIPSTVKLIKARAFASCWSLERIYCYAEVPPTLGENVFIGVDHYNCILYVPKSCIPAYQAAEQWKDFQDIREIDESAGINAITNSPTFRPKTYNLQGLPVNDAFKGIVIRNGKKRILK